jgi:predicted dithiol-disulfide oxidoreductase (DUF899 family)
MKYQESAVELRQLRSEITALRKRMRGVQTQVAPQIVKDYAFSSAEGSVLLSALFGSKDDLFVIHNMGESCPYCTMWADGFNGVVDHLQSRAAFVVSSPDAPAQQQQFKESRGWRFRMVSHQNTSFAADMGYKGDASWMPGVSVFKRSAGNIVRVSDTPFEPGDDFCAAWHLFDLIPEGAADWSPKLRYGK